MNAIIARLTASADVTERGLVSGRVGSDGRSDLDALTRTSWAEVHARARAIAGALQIAGVATGDAVAVLAGGPGEIAPLVQGIWMSGASVTMLHHPTHRTDLAAWADEVAPTLSGIGARTLVIGEPFLAAAETLADSAERVLFLPELLDGPAGPIVDLPDDAVAFQQLTSGSTGRAKAVAISYRNIEANLRGMAEAANADPQSDVVVSWLPLFHDMGMMGFLITPMCLTLDTVKVTPVDFLADPLLWPRLIGTYRGSLTAAPNFAYSLMARRFKKAADGAYDLSSLRFALSGAEAVDPATLDKFVTEGARFGLRRGVIAPAYGMAEATLGVSFVRPGQEYQIRSPHPDVVADRGDTQQRVALGPPLPGCEVRVLDDAGTVLEPVAIGELAIKGDNVTRGYRTAEGIEPVTDADGWFRTGDIGYLTEDGHPVICGRKKDVLIISGRNVHPEDIERSTAGVSGIRSGGVAAVRFSAGSAGEGFAMVAESALHSDDAQSARIRNEIADHVFRKLGISPRTVHVVPAGWLPKTSSGKIRRSEAANRLHRLAEFEVSR